jgi:hypothetical protein
MPGRNNLKGSNHYHDTIAAAKERILALSAWSKRNPGATYEDAKKLFGKGDKLFANKD